MLDVRKEKELLRQKIWKIMETEQIARFPLPCYGRIPNFYGSEKTADKIRTLKEWKEAKTIFANPDYAQQKIREAALMDGKLLIMASPRLKQGFIIVNPKEVKGKESFASTIRGAFKHGKTVDVENIPKPDLIIEGTVAVDLKGHRLGKGHGYGDVEIEIMKKLFGAIPVVTAVHDVQVVESVPFEEKDEKVSIVITPTRVIRV